MLLESTSLLIIPLIYLSLAPGDLFLGSQSPSHTRLDQILLVVGSLLAWEREETLEPDRLGQTSLRVGRWVGYEAQWVGAESAHSEGVHHEHSTLAALQARPMKVAVVSVVVKTVGLSLG